MKIIKSMFSFMLVSVMLLTSMITVSANELDKLESGIYEVENDVYHENEIGMSMSRTYLKPTMKIEKSKGKVYYTVGFTGTDYMENYRIILDGKDIGAEIVSENPEEKSIDLKFEANSLEPKMKANIYVDAMGRDVEFDIITKTDTLKLIEKIDEPKEEVKTTDEKTTNKKTTKQEEKSSENDSNNLLFIGLGIAVVAGVSTLIFNKSNKKSK